MTSPAPPPEPSSSPPAARRVRLAVVLVLFIGLLVASRVFGWHEQVSVEALRAAVRDAGAWGVLLFLAAFSVGTLLHVPGLVFVAAGILSWGRGPGGVLVFFGALLAVSVTFGVVRGVGGRALEGSRSRLLRRALAHLEARPIRTIALLRVVFLVSPPVSYALALSPVRYRQFLAGSALGLLPAIAFLAFFFDWIAGYLQ